MPWWSWGYTANFVGRSGWLPAGPNPPLTDAQLTSFPAGVTIVQLDCYESGGAACSDTGDIYVWGDCGGVGGTVAQGNFGDQFPGSGTSYAVVNPPQKLNYVQASNAKQVALTNVGTFWLKNDGTVWGVGWNQSGEFGLGEARPTYHGTPVQLTGLPSGITHIRTTVFWGSGLYAVDPSGRLWYAGGIAENPVGPGMGSGFTDPSSYHLTHDLVPNMTSYGPVKDVTMSFSQPPGSVGAQQGYCFLVLMADGTVMWWGRDMTMASAANHPPTVLSGVTGIQQIFGTTGSPAVYFLTTSGQVLGLGGDDNGALCNGTWSGAPYTSTYTAVHHWALPPLTIGTFGPVIKLAHGSSSTYAMFAVTSDGGVWGWGLNDYMWGTSDPTSGGAGSSIAISPPYQVFSTVFGTAPLHPLVDIAIMAENALFVHESAPPSVAIPSRLATIVG